MGHKHSFLLDTYTPQRVFFFNSMQNSTTLPTIISSNITTNSTTTNLPEILLSPTPYEKVQNCIFTSNFLPPKSVAIRISNQNVTENEINFSNSTSYENLLNSEFSTTASIEYSCLDPLKQYQGIKNTTCLENGEWSKQPHNNLRSVYCINEAHEEVRERIAKYISAISILIIFMVISGFCCACITKRARRKKKIRAAQLARQNQVMFDNQAYLDDSR